MEQLHKRRALLVGTFFCRVSNHKECEDFLDELAELVHSSDIEASERVICPLRKASVSILIGSGRLKEIIALVEEKLYDLVVFDDELTPAQQRNLEKAINKPVLDRTEIILEVFASKARTREARIQVQMAQIKYSLPRLKRLWSHLSRQKGGGVNQKGEGETQIELDRRLLKTQMYKLAEQLEEVNKDRNTIKKSRERSGVFCFAIVGYTNAGKSTLMNRLTGASVYVEDKLFATLDTTTRRLILPSKLEILITDTVGFIRKLPHTLVAAFRSTLEGSLEADCLLHLVDASHPSFREHIKATDVVFRELKIGQRPTFMVFNKIDRLNDSDRNILEGEFPDAIYCSALQNIGIDELLSLMHKCASTGRSELWLDIPAHQYELVANLYAIGAIIEQILDEQGVYHLHVTLPKETHNLYAPFISRPYEECTSKA